MSKGMFFNFCHYLCHQNRFCHLNSMKKWVEKLKKTKASHFGPSVYHYKLLKGKPTELERLMEAEVTN